ncbi:MAG TPA: DUF4404 family protein [Telluria sp.]|nr:DUF4404 family protein [Telluria sp.]
MQDSKESDLKAHLKTLHASLASAEQVDEELRGLLTQLDADIRSLLEARAAAAPDAAALEESQTYGLAERAQELTAQFAARHPRLEPALRELGSMLSNLGI